MNDEKYDSYILSNRPLNVERFEGLLVRHPLHIDCNKKLYLTVEHHADVSLGGYEVVIGEESSIFFKLSEAVNFFNEN